MRNRKKERKKERKKKTQSDSLLHLQESLISEEKKKSTTKDINMYHELNHVSCLTVIEFGTIVMVRTSVIKNVHLDRLID